MIKRLAFLLLLGMMLLMAPSSHASNIHLRYFESADALLTNSAFQLFSFAAIDGEKVTVVAYGIDDNLLPTLTVLDVNGITLAEDLNEDANEVSVIELVAPDNGLYTFLVSRRSDAGGLVRVLLFTGDPLSGNLTRLDTVDPLLPGRAYLVAGGSTEEPLEMAVTVLEEEEADTTDTSPSTPTEIFAARGSELSAPPVEERTSPIQQKGWENEEGDIFYTLIVRALPDPLPATSQKLGAQFSTMAQFLDIVDIQIDIGQGGEPEPIQRPICKGNVIVTSPLLAGPAETYIEVGDITAPQDVEIIGFFGQYLLILDLNSPTGGSWIARNSVQIDETLSSPSCARVVEMAGPEPNEDNTVQQGDGGSRPSDPFAGLPPSGPPADDKPPADDDGGGDGVSRDNPDDTLGNSGGSQGAITFTCDGYNHVINWSGLTTNSIITYSHDSSCSSGSPYQINSSGESGSEYLLDACNEYINITATVNDPPVSVSTQLFCEDGYGGDGY